MTTTLQLDFQAFTRLPEQDRSIIDRLARRNVREIGPRRDLIREGEKPRAVNLMLEGWACRYKQLPDGRRQIVSFLVPGDLCDANAFILSEMDHSIGAITRLKFAEIGHGEFEDMMLNSPRLTQALWRNALVSAAIAREWTTNVGQRTAYERLAHLFCEMFVRLGSVGLTSDYSCDWPLTQSDLADATGLTSVHVNRTLQELRRDGLIELECRRLTLPRLDALKTVAMFNPNYLHLNGECRYPDSNE